MQNSNIMTWVDELPNVQNTDFVARRNLIADVVDQAAQLVEQAAKLRQQAYFDSLKLEGDAKRHWSISAVEAAKSRLGS